jgi:hypothetical protein
LLVLVLGGLADIANELKRLILNATNTLALGALNLLLLKIALVVSINTAIAGEGNIELNRFTEVDTSSAYNDNGGY